MIKRIAKMENHYIICGCGRVGRNIALELYKSGHEFVMTDLNDELLAEFEKEVPNSAFLAGDGTDDLFLEILGIKKATGIFANAADDNTNLVICITARQLNPHIKIITRINDMTHAKKMKRAGADKIISPTYIGGLRMALEMVKPAATSFIDDLTSNPNFNLHMEQVTIPLSFEGKTIEELPLAGCEKTIILAVKSSGEWLYNPKKYTELKTGNRLMLMTTPDERKLIEQRLQ